MNGNKVFEGDIVDILHEGIYQCYWDDGNFEFAFKNERESFGMAHAPFFKLSVIGNIHDSPEVLEV